MKLFSTIILFTISINTLAQTTPERKWIHTEATYSDSEGNTFSVTNSLPKGGGTYNNSEGKTYSYVNFWYRVTNTSEVPMELKIEFPNKQFVFFPSPNSHIRIFLPKETMTTEKIEMFDYGLSNLKDFLDTEFYEPSVLQKTINANEEYLFYVSVLIYQAQGSARAAFVMKGNDLFYQIKIDPNDNEIPCGKIAFKN